MSGLNVLGKGFAATFTERMTLDEGSGSSSPTTRRPVQTERAAVARLVRPDATPRAAPGWRPASRSASTCRCPRSRAPAVRSAMKGVMATMGDRFSKHLLAHLER